jgi:hypothetical protein
MKPIHSTFYAIALKGIGHESDENEWLNYRRNHIQIALDFGVAHYNGRVFLNTSHQHCSKVEQSVKLSCEDKPKVCFEATNTSCQEVHEISRIFVHCDASSSYDQNSSMIAADKLQPVCLTQGSPARVASELKVFEPVTVIDFSKPSEGQGSLSLDRIQFSRATLGNYLSFTQMEAFTIELNLYAETVEGECIQIGYALGLPCISRGRAPCHFEKLCPQHADPTRKRISSQVSKRIQRKPFRVSSPIPRVLTPPQDISFMLPHLYIPSDGYAFFEPSQYVSPSDIFGKNPFLDDLDPEADLPLSPQSTISVFQHHL